MLNKKNLFVLAVIINIIIMVFSSVNVRADDAPAGDEYATIANSLPDALILWDLSGSMAQTPGGDATYFYGSDTSCVANTTLCNNPNDTTYPYSYDNTCTPDTVHCPGSPSTTYIYGADATCTANSNPGACISGATTTYKYAADATCTANSAAGKCVGTGSSTYKYAYDSSCTANTSKCTSKGTTTCSGGFCNGTGQGNCVTDCSNNSGKLGYCSGGFCGTAGKTGCSTDCSNTSGKLGYCSGGFCGTAGKTGCSYDCNCQNGMCVNSHTPNCANKCATNKCSNGFCSDTAQGDCSTDCSKLAIAKRALFSILDDDNSLTIDALDMTSMGIRIGFMRFTTGDDTTGDYTSGNNKLVDVISTITGGVSSNNQTSYSLTYCGNSTSCASTVTSCTTGECMAGETASGGTPLASALKEAKTYLDAHKAGDSYKNCRQKFVIVITDGADTYFGCSGTSCGQECQTDGMYRRRREVVAATKQLADAGYKVFVVGFGSTMPVYLQNTLNWMAWYGGTDNPLLADSGSKTAYNIPLGCTATPAVTSACCNLSTNATACFPSGITSGKTESSSNVESATCSGSSTSSFRAKLNDPGYKDNSLGNGADETTLTLQGYAFLAGDADSLTSALKSAIDTIKAATYSFTHASIQAQRTADENYLYEASFEPLATDPLWIGHLKRFSLAADATGAIKSTPDWDAGVVLQGVPDDGLSSPRNIYSYTTDGTSSGMNYFIAGNLSNANLGVTTDAQRVSLIKFIRQGDYAYTSDSAFYKWKLGDILHTSPLSVPTPNNNFYDTLDQTPPTSAVQCYDPTTSSCSTCTSGKAFNQYLCQHIRKTSINNGTAAGNRIILIGANDGQLHAFKTYDGSEAWSFIPPNLLPRLSYITHTKHPTDLTHTYFVDGPMSAAEVWLAQNNGTDSHNINHDNIGKAIGTTYKLPQEWHTYLVMSEGRGGISTLWSQYASCACPSTAANCGTTGTNPAFSSTYSSTYNNYCGFYALDVTETTTTAPLVPPAFKWKLGGTSGLSSSASSYDQPAFLGQPWSKMFFGRVRINNIEKWVGLIGAGYSGTNCAGTTTCSDKRGKGFYVLDVSNGQILWSFTHDGSGNAGNTNMDYNLVAGPVGIDSDNDGFVDTAYVGDLGGNVWRFKFCLKSQGASCNVSNWTGNLLFNNHP